MPAIRYKKIIQLLAIAFAFLSILIITDFFLPREKQNTFIESLQEDDSYHPKYAKKPYYTIEVNGQVIRTESETFQVFSVGDSMVVEQTKILGKITSLKNRSNPAISANIFVAPFAYYPLFPILFFLPIVFFKIKGETILLMILRPLSLGIALISLLMILL